MSQWEQFEWAFPERAERLRPIWEQTREADYGDPDREWLEREVYESLHGREDGDEYDGW